MNLFHRSTCLGAAAVLGLSTAALTGSLVTSAGAGTAAASTIHRPAFTALRGSKPKTTDSIVGRFSSPRMSVEVALAPRHQAGLNKRLKATYTQHSGMYHQWLAKGQFYSRYAPSAAKRASVTRYLRNEGLVVHQSRSPFLVRASGSSARVSAAFHTTLNRYRDPKGVRYFSNSSAVRLPRALAPGVLGVIGLSNTVREHSMAVRTKGAGRPQSNGGASASCETGYPSAATFFNLVNNGVNFPFGYGGAPGCNGLTPSQTNSIYGAPNVGPRGKGAGVNIAVFELSAYLHSDINTYAAYVLRERLQRRRWSTSTSTVAR